MRIGRPSAFVGKSPAQHTEPETGGWPTPDGYFISDERQDMAAEWHPVRGVVVIECVLAKARAPRCSFSHRPVWMTPSSGRRESAASDRWRWSSSAATAPSSAPARRLLPRRGSGLPPAGSPIALSRLSQSLAAAGLPPDEFAAPREPSAQTGRQPALQAAASRPAPPDSPPPHVWRDGSEHWPWVLPETTVRRLTQLRARR